MDNEIKIFVGMLKNAPNIFIMGEIDQVGEKTLYLKNVVRVMEAPGQDHRITYQFMPDPYFTAERSSQINRDDYLLQRIETDGAEKMVREYQDFLVKLRVARSGLVPPPAPKAPTPSMFTTGR